MGEIKQETLKKAYKPYDIVTSGDNVGYIQEVSVNHCQVGFDNQISYAVNWLIGDETKHAWWKHEELTKHANMFVEIAKCSCHPFSSNNYVEKLMNL